MFCLLPENDYGEEALRLGLIEHTGEELKQDYVDVMVPLFEGLDLCVPEDKTATAEVISRAMEAARQPPLPSPQAETAGRLR